MKKCIVFAIVVFLFTSPTASFSNDRNKKEFDPNIIKPDNVEKFLDIAHEETKENIGGIKEYFDEYMKTIRNFVKKQSDLINKTFFD